MELRTLTPLEARVLGVLVEKQHTVPDTYPLSLNALQSGCNQKTARAPVMEAAEADLVVAVDSLKHLHLVFEVSGSRVARYEHNLGRVLGVPSQSVALLAVLMLRGPQTAAELRLNCERLHRFADVSSVEAFLDELATKAPARVVKLPRAPGEREARWAHLLCGEPALPAAGFAAAPSGEGGVAAGEVAALRGEVTRLSEELSALRAELAAVKAELGLS
ncbi:MAG: YceH family protein [Burkholderiaceae bacterium]